MQNPSQAIVVSETKQLLEAERARCATLAAKLAQDQARLRKSRAEWAPAYQRWYGEEVAPLANRARELRAQLCDQHAFIHHVKSAARLLGCKPKEAAPLVQRAFRGQVILEELEQEFYETGHFPAAPLHPDVEAHLRLAFARARQWRKNTAPFEEGFQEFKREWLRKVFGQESECAPYPPPEIRLKQLYRELARRLHPDSHPGATERDRELWHEASAAFQAQDTATLEDMLTARQAGARFEAVDSLGRLRSLLKRLEGKLQQAARELRQEKRRPWWKLGEPVRGQPPEERRRQLRRAEEDSIRQAEGELAELGRLRRSWDA